jgi:hypothetical protein
MERLSRSERRLQRGRAVCIIVAANLLVWAFGVAMATATVQTPAGRTRARLGDVAGELAAAEQALAETEADLRAARTEVAEIRTTLRARASIVYQQHGNHLGMALSVDRPINLHAGAHYADAVAAVDTKELDRLERVIADLGARRDAQDAVRRDLAAVEHALDDLGGVSVMGPSLLTAPDLAAWFESTGQHAWLSGTTTIDDLAALYVSEGAAEGVRGDFAFAQAVLETGSFGNAIDNNYAGIGACDGCRAEMRFPTPRDGVRAQIQLLRNYADPDSRAARLANPPDATLYGDDPVRAASLYDTFPFKGRAPVWNVMGGGNWATDPHYAGKILAIYQRMLAFKAGLARDRLG